MTCALCRGTMDYVHGHGACLNPRCPMFGLNQAECCTGETAGQCTAAAFASGSLPPSPGAAPARVH